MGQPTLQYWAATDVGGLRSNNEDAFLCLTPETHPSGCYLWAVCDGMGGESAGELASASVVQTLADVYPAALASRGDPREALTEALQAANRRLLYMQRENPALHRMGTTAAVVAWAQEALWIASVGDSRVYLWDGRALTCLTRDQTKFEKMREMGLLSSEEQQPDHPAHNVLISVLGREGMTIDTRGVAEASPENAVLLVCSDGLSNVVDERTMAAALRDLSARDACEALISVAYPVSRDNITAQVIRFGATPTGGPTLAAFLVQHGVERRFGLPEQLRLTSFDDDPRDRWATHQTGQHVLASTKAPVAPASPPVTMLLSPDHLVAPQPQAAPVTPVRDTPSHGVGALPREPLAPPVSGSLKTPRQSPHRERRLDASSLSTSVFRALAGGEPRDGDAKKSWSQRPLLAFLVAIVSTGIAFSAVWGLRSRQRAAEPVVVESPTAEVPRRIVTPTPQAEESIVLERQPLGDFVFAPVPRAPDLEHAADGMPAYVVADGALVMDAHEVTVQQFRGQLAVSPELQGLHRAVDAPRYRELPCSSGVSSDWNGEREPVCVSVESADAYCRSVGRRLPTRDDWRAFQVRDSQLIAPGYGVLFRYGHAGPPPAIPVDVDGLYGVLDGLPESLTPTPLEQRRGDVVTLGQSPDSRGMVTVHAGLQRQWDEGAVSAGLTPMLGFRCVEDRVVTASRRGSTGESARRRVAPAPSETADASATTSRIHAIELRELPEDYDTRYQTGASSRFHSYILETFLRKRDGR